MTPLLNRVAGKMPVVVHDSDAPKSQRKAFVGTNNVEAGRLAGQAAIAALKQAGITKGKVAMFVGRIDMQNSMNRKQGIDETLGERPGIEILPIFLDGADRTKAKKNVEDALARYPDLVMVVGLWSYNGPAMVDAVRGFDAHQEAANRRLQQGRGDSQGGRGRDRSSPPSCRSRSSSAISREGVERRSKTERPSRR